MGGLLLLAAATSVGCNDFLDEEANNVFTQHQIFSDNALIESTLANFYGRVEWGQSFSEMYQYTLATVGEYRTIHRCSSRTTGACTIMA